MGRKKKNKQSQRVSQTPSPPIPQETPPVKREKETGQKLSWIPAFARMTGKEDSRNLYALALFFAVLAVYLLTMPRVVTFEDSPGFNMSCYYAQPAHPPGYPLYSILCFPFAHLPFLSVPMGGNLLSALLGAAGCAVLFLIAVNLGIRRTYALMAGACFGFSKIFWSQAIIQEVYSLHSLLLLSAFLFALLYSRNPKIRYLKWFAAFAGFSLANHYPLFMLSSPALIFLLIPSWRRIAGHLGDLSVLRSVAVIFLATGVVPYLYLFMTNLDSPVNFYGPIESFESLKFYITRSGYSAVDNQKVSMFEKIAYLKLIAESAVAQYGLLFTPFAAAGFVLSWRRWGKAVCCAVAALYLCSTWLLVPLVDFQYSELLTGAFSVYSVAAYSSFALWGALAVQYGMEKAHEGAGGLFTDGRIRRFSGIAFSVAMVAAVALSNFSFNNRAQDRLAHGYSRAIIDGLDNNAVLLIEGETEAPISELNLIEGVRKDVAIYNTTGIFLANRYVSAFSNSKEKDAATKRLIKETRRPVYYLGNVDHGYGVEDFGLYKKVRKDLPAGRRKVTLRPEVLNLWEESELRGDDLHFNSIIKRSIRLAIAALVFEADNVSPEVRKAYEEKMTNGSYYEISTLAQVFALFSPDLKPSGVKISDLVDKAGSIAPADVKPKDRARLLNATAFAIVNFKERKGPEAIGEAVEILKKSLNIYPSPENLAVQSLLSIFRDLKDREGIMKIRKRYPFVERENAAKN